MTDPLQELESLLSQYEEAKATQKLLDYKPYPFQKKFHFAHGHLTPGILARDRAIIAANKVGKTVCAAAEVAMHATGMYPDDWQGHRFKHASDFLCAGNTFDTTRDIQQSELFGKPEDDAMLGTGWIPRDCIIKVVRKVGVPNAFESVQVLHKPTGKESTIQFKAYEQGFKKFMGKGWRIIWADEEPPSDVLSQMHRAMFAIHDAILICTFTPEEGMTKVVSRYMNELQKGQAVITATWDDAPHMTPEVRAEKLAGIPKHEHDLRAKGLPISGAGLIFPIDDEHIVVDPFQIPPHWPQLVGIDFGYDHPFGAAHLAWDRDSDTIYIVNDYAETKALPPIHAHAVQQWGGWLPIAWPHDGLQTEKGSGEDLSVKYKELGLNMLPERATNPPRIGEPEGSGGISVEAALLEMNTRFEEGRLKVVRTCNNFLREKRTYHRKPDGRIVKLMDDVISAARYGVMMIRHARVAPRDRRHGLHMDRTKNGVPYLSARPVRRG